MARKVLAFLSTMCTAMSVLTVLGMVALAIRN